LASFGGKATVMTDVYASDISTRAMESITPNLYDYWCHIDEYMTRETLMTFIVNWAMLQKILEVKQIQICYVWKSPTMMLLV